MLFPSNAQEVATLLKLLCGQSGGSQPTATPASAGIMASTATLQTTYTYSGAALSGASCSPAGTLVAPGNVTATTTSATGAYNVGVGNAIIVTGTDYYTSLPATEALVLTAVNGGETVLGTRLWAAAALSFYVPAQVLSTGHISLGIGTAAPGVQQVQPAASATWAVSSPTYALGGTGQKTAASPAVALTAVSTVYSGGVAIENTDAALLVYVGPAGVTASTGKLLRPGGPPLAFGSIDLATIYIFSTGSPVVDWIGLTRVT